MKIPKILVDGHILDGQPQGTTTYLSGLYKAIAELNLAEIFIACCEENLKDIKIEWSTENSLCIVICSKGYPDNFEKYVEIKNLNKIKLKKNEFIFHAGTSKKSERIFAKGGRVLNFITLSKDFGIARETIIENITKLNWDGGFYRKDIGHKVIK